MRLQHLALGLAVATVAASAATAAQAADGIFVPLFTYRTGPFAGSGIPIANGMADYLNMLNERDGGIGGVSSSLRSAKPATTRNKASNAMSR